MQEYTFDTEKPKKERVKGTFESKDFALLNFVRGKGRSAYEFLIHQNQMLENKKGAATCFLDFSEWERCL